MGKEEIEDMKRVYSLVKEDIQKRLDGFKYLWEKGSEEDIFAEFVFCLLTPQSKATSCWGCVENLLEKNLLWEGNANQIAGELNRTRFKHKKAHYIVEARKLFTENGEIIIKPRITQFKDAKEAREWFVCTIKGMGHKEASHFLRNIGLGENLAILDRHVLKNLKLLGAIKEVSKNISKKRYLEIEEKMRKFAEGIEIPLSHLDLLMWYKEAGEIFK